MARRVLTGEKLEKELERLSLMREFERQYEDCAFICGIDEAGRGPLAGPVAAGAAILPKDCQILYLNDSKKLSESRREELFLEIKEKAIAWSVGIVGPERIDEINILQATYEAVVSKSTSGEFWGLVKKGMEQAIADVNEAYGFKKEEIGRAHV